MALGHQVGNAVERAYRRTDLIDQRRAFMEALASFCERRQSDNVIQLNGRRA
jgi:hypothetical protein